MVPYITVEGGKLTKEQKEEEIMKVPAEFFCMTGKELDDTSIGIGGKTIDKTKKEYFEKHN